MAGGFCWRALANDQLMRTLIHLSGTFSRWEKEAPLLDESLLPNPQFRHSSHIDRLDIHELVDAVIGEFAAKS